MSKRAIRGYAHMHETDGDNLVFIVREGQNKTVKVYIPWSDVVFHVRQIRHCWETEKQNSIMKIEQITTAITPKNP